MIDREFPSGKDESYTVAFASYRRVRRMIGWSLWAGLFGALLVLSVLFLGGALDDRLWPQIVLLAAAVLMFSSIFGAFGGIFILRFLWMCPRCGETFGLAGRFMHHARSCQNCGLTIRDAGPSMSVKEGVRASPLLRMLHWPFQWRLTFGRFALATASAAPFLLISAATAIHAVRVIHAHSAVAHWDLLDGQLAVVEYRAGDDPQVEYMYQVRGIDYRGRTFSFARCNTSNYWARMETEKLRRALGRPGGITVYHDPSDPAKSCLYRDNSPAWGELLCTGFGVIVAIVLSLGSLLDLRKAQGPT